MTRARGSFSVVLLLLLGCACTGVRPAATGGPLAAVYRARFLAAEPDSNKRFRFRVYAELPDRLHGEIISGVGTTELVIDAGAGRMSVLFVRERVAYVGSADDRALQALTGLPLGTAEFVQALRGSDPGAASRLDWELELGDYPYAQKIRVEHAGAALELTLKRVRPLRGSTVGLGTGGVPDGVTVRPLEALDGTIVPGIEDASPGGV